MSALRLAMISALFLAGVAACESEHRCKIFCFVDANGDAPGPCSPRLQTGCQAREKCTWLVDASHPQYAGHIGCAAIGDAPVGAVCMFGAPGLAGYDDCVAGAVCSAYRGGLGICLAICDPQGGAPACDATQICRTPDDLFAELVGPSAGVCELAVSRPVESVDPRR